MTRLEVSAWSLAGGSACVFAFSIVLARLPWQAAFAAVALMVVVWAWQGRLAAGAALGGIAWLCVTGFDVHRFGYIGMTGSDDVLRGTLLVLVGVLAVAAHALTDAARSHRRADVVWADFHERDLESAELPETPARSGVGPPVRRAPGEAAAPPRPMKRERWLIWHSSH